MRARRQSIFFIRQITSGWMPRNRDCATSGIDGFLADVAGKADGVTFVTAHGTHCPAVALTIHGVEWPMSFPNPLLIQKVNSRVRSDPARLTADPYGAGWLFEGLGIAGTDAGRAGLGTASGGMAGRGTGAADTGNPRDACAGLRWRVARAWRGATTIATKSGVPAAAFFFQRAVGWGRNDESAEHDRVRARAGDGAGGGMDCLSARPLRAAAAASRVSA